MQLLVVSLWNECEVSVLRPGGVRPRLVAELMVDTRIRRFFRGCESDALSQKLDELLPLGLRAKEEGPDALRRMSTRVSTLLGLLHDGYQFLGVTDRENLFEPPKSHNIK